MWTLEYNGTEKPLADWGFDTQGSILTRINQGMDELSLMLSGWPVDEAAPFLPYSQIILRSDRDATPDGESFSGGEQRFVGIMGPEDADGSDEAENMDLVFYGPAFWFQNVTFEMQWQQVKGFDSHGNPILVTLTSPHLFLSLATPPAPFGRITTGPQITAAINWILTSFAAASAPAPFQIGAITPNLDLPIDEVFNISVEEVIQKMLRPTPDAVTWFDYSTVPPTYYCKRRAELTAVDIALVGGIVDRIKMKPRRDLLRTFVSIDYEITATVSGQQVRSTVFDNYPTPLPTNYPEKFQGVRYVVNLQGNTISQASATITVAAINTGDPNWWFKHHPDLNPATTGTDVATVTFNNVTRAALDGRSDQGYGYEVDDGQLGNWQNGQRIRFTATADVDYDNGTKHRQVPISFDVTTTDQAQSGTFYGPPQVQVPAEPVPVGLAQAIFNAVNVLQWEGTLTLEEVECSNTVSLGNIFNFTGSKNDIWRAINAMVSHVTETLGDGRTTIQFGPPRQLTANELVDLLSFSRFRNIRTAYTACTQGTLSNPTTLALGKNATKENSSSTSGYHEAHVVSDQPDASQNVIVQKIDPERGPIIRMTDESDLTGPLIEIAVGDLGDDDVAQFRAVGGGKVLCTAGVNFGGGSVNYRGTYDPSVTYNKGDIVRKRTGGSQGVWIMVATSPVTGLDPIFPEPADVDGTKTNTWELFAPAILAQPICNGNIFGAGIVPTTS